MLNLCIQSNHTNIRIMRLKVETIYRIDGFDRRHGGLIKRALGQELGKGINSIYLYLRENRENGDLTKLAALKLIAGMLEVSLDSLTE